MPLTWIVSVAQPRRSGYRPLDEIRADGPQALGATDLELAVGLAARRSSPCERNRQLARELGTVERLVAIGMDELPVRPEARRRPAVLLVDAALAGIELRAAATSSAQAQRSCSSRDERSRSARSTSPGRARGSRASRSADAGARPTRSSCSPSPGPVAAIRSTNRLPLRVVAERRRRAVPRQVAEHLGADREHPGLAPLEVRRVRREREHERQPRQDRLHARGSSVARPASRRGRAAR